MGRKIRMVVVPIIMILSILMLVFSRMIIHDINSAKHFDEVVTHSATITGFESRNTVRLRGGTIYRTLVNVRVDNNESASFIRYGSASDFAQTHPVGSQIEVYEFHGRYGENIADVLTPPNYSMVWVIIIMVCLFVNTADYIKKLRG